MFTFANCLILAFLFVVASTKSTKIQHQNPPQFWHQLMQKSGICDEQINGICDEQIKQMADEMDKSDSFIEKLSKEENYNKPLLPSPKQPAFENQLKHPGTQSLIFNLFKLDNFYELVKGQGEVTKLVQDLAKTFINIKSSLIKNGQIAITTILDKTENAMNFLAKQNGIVYEKAEQIELPEIVQSMATIWSEMSRTKNGGEKIVQKIVNLWQSSKQNDQSNKGNKREGKNRRRKRRTPCCAGQFHGTVLDYIIIGGLAVFAIFGLLYFCYKINRD